MKRLPKNSGHEWFVYILECSDGSLYTGYTNDVFKRVAAHNYATSTGAGASKYTRSRRPVKLVHYEIYPTKRDAIKREAAIKALSREEKIKYIALSNVSGSKQM